MTAMSELVVAELPSCSGWEFGGFPYGLEPLTLPEAGAAPLAAAADGDESDSFAWVCDYTRMLARGRVALDGLEPCEALDELYWFRWITGHQVCFVVWRLMTELTDGAEEGDISLEDAHAGLATYVRAYAAMLLYTGSCPRTVYEDVIRPSMRLQHRAFTGGWASDYWPLRRLFRGDGSKLRGLPGADPLIRSLDLHRIVHDGVAVKLVPDGKSLLRKSSARGQDRPLLNLIYDNYFMTLRAPVSRSEMISQLLRRLVAIGQDVAVNDLYCSSVVDVDERPPEHEGAEVRDCERRFGEILFEVAECAAGLPAGWHLRARAGGLA